MTLQQLLLPGVRECEVLGYSSPRRHEELQAKIQAGLRAHPQWALDHAAKVPAGPLPWHENLGLTREEYAEFHRLLAQMKIAPVGHATVRVDAREDGRYHFGGDLADLNDVSLDSRRSGIDTPFGSCSPFLPVAPSDKQTRTGPWRGFACSTSSGDLAAGHGMSMAFHVGRLEASGMLLLSYTAKLLKSPSKLYRADILLRCSAAGALAK